MEILPSMDAVVLLADPLFHTLDDVFVNIGRCIVTSLSSNGTTAYLHYDVS